MSSVRRLVKIIAFIIAVALLVILIYETLVSCNEEPYAFQGAYLEYRVTGPINYTITYRVESVHNNAITYVQLTHYPNGTWKNKTYVENINNPINFPTLPHEEIGKKNITLFNLTFQLVGKKKIVLNNRSYETFEYIYGKIDFIMDIFIDSSTGVVLKGNRQFYSYSWSFELIDTNINSKCCMPQYGAIGCITVLIALVFYWICIERNNHTTTE